MCAMVKPSAAVSSRLVTVVVAAGLVGLTGCASENPPPASPPPSPASADPGVVALAPPYRHPTEGYQVRPPVGWVQQATAPQDGISVLFSSPTPDSSGQNSFTSNLNVFITPARGTLDDSVATTIGTYPSVLRNYQLITNDPTVIAGDRPAHLLGGTYDVPGVGRLQNLQLVVVDAGKLYTVTVTCPEHSYPELRKTALAALSSFIPG
jgi:hypothetical protein